MKGRHSSEERSGSKKTPTQYCYYKADNIFIITITITISITIFITTLHSRMNAPARHDRVRTTSPSQSPSPSAQDNANVAFFIGKVANLRSSETVKKREMGYGWERRVMYVLVIN
jgi:hypothetical protein